MSVTFCLNRQVVTLDDNEIMQLRRNLVAVVRMRVWNPARVTFDSWVEKWEGHNEMHSINLGLLLVEMLGGANLPPASLVRNLRSRRNLLHRQVNINGINDFFLHFDTWARRASRFRQDMYRYGEDLQLGTERTVRGLTITRDASFVALATLANIFTLGGASAFTVAGSAAAGALVQSAAIGYVTVELRNAAIRLGRTAAGDPPSAQESAEQALNAAINAVPDAAMGAIAGAMIGPITRNVSDAATREIARGNLAEGVSQQVAVDFMNQSMQGFIDNFIRRHPADVRPLLRDARNTRNNNQTAAVIAQGLMRNRIFRRDLESRLERGR